MSANSSMIVFCEDCGKRYQIDPNKIKGKEAKFKCKSCNHIIEVKKPEKKGSEQPEKTPLVREKASVSEEKRLNDPEIKPTIQPLKTFESECRKPKFIGLRTKMAIFFLIIPTILMIAAGGISIWQFKTLSATLNDSTDEAGLPISGKTAKNLSPRLAESSSRHVISRTRNNIIGIWTGAVVLAAAIVSIYGYRLTKKIQTLSEMTERISLGDIKTEMTIESNDEIGTIGNAVTRMQDSICLAIERLRHRRS